MLYEVAWTGDGCCGLHGVEEGWWMVSVGRMGEYSGRYVVSGFG